MSDYPHWHVGMKVVFIGYPAPAVSRVGRRRIKSVEYLTVGETYTIMDIAVRENYSRGKWAGPSFFVGCRHGRYGLVWHHNSGFLPLDARKTDISIFTAMLTGAKEREPA